LFEARKYECRTKIKKQEENMKKQMLNKQLVLKKETVAVLNSFELNCVQGGTACPPPPNKVIITYPFKGITYTCGL
jgi:hypothetical protein